jgi:hypothetical protein
MTREVQDLHYQHQEKTRLDLINLVKEERQKLISGERTLTNESINVNA